METVREAVHVYARVAAACALSVLLACAVGAAMPARALGITAPDQTRSCSLSAECLVSGEAVSGLQLSLYRVATFSGEGPFALTDDFADSGVDLAGLSKASEWASAASTLDAYARTAGLVPRATVVTTQVGVASISGLEPGLYLSLKASGEVSGEPCTCAAFLVSVPGEASDGVSWNYHVAVAPKFELGAGDDADAASASHASARTKLATTGDAAQGCAAVAMVAAVAAIGVAGMARRTARRGC